MKRYSRFLMLFLIILLVLATVTRVQASVTLGDFEAIADLVTPKITLWWQMGSENDYAGSYIQRSFSPDSGFVPLQDTKGKDIFFPAQGEGGPGTYFYDDTNVIKGMLYYYELKMVDLEGGISYSPVISVLLDNTPTPTATFTATPTNTQDTRTPTVTRTPTSPTVTRTKTHQPTATITRTPSPYHIVTFTSRPRPTSTQTETSTITSTPSVSPSVTTTLIPLPSLTLLFPAHTHTPTFTPSPTVTSSPIPPSPSPTQKPDYHIPLRTSFLGGIIVLLWITLAGFLFAYLRRVSR